MFDDILIDLLKSAVTSGLTGLLLWLWGRRAARRAAEKIEVIFLSPFGRFDPGVRLRRDEVSRSEVLGLAGAAVGGQAAGVALPLPFPSQIDEVKSGVRDVLHLVFTDQASFDKAVDAAEVVAGRKARPAKPAVLPLATQEAVQALQATVSGLSTEVGKVVEAVRSHTLLLDRQRPLPALARLEKEGNGMKSPPYGFKYKRAK